MSLKQLEAHYKQEGALGIGSHYVIDRNGDVHKGRPREEHPNVHPRHNRDSVAIEVMCSSQEDMTSKQRLAVEGAVEYLQDIYPNAEPLDLTL